MPLFCKNTIGNLWLLLQKASAKLDEDITRLSTGD